MQKIDERVDISRKVLEIDVESPIFEGMLNDVNKEIQRVIKKVYNEEFGSGEIALKLTIEIPNAIKIIPKVDEYGEMINETYQYRKPIFEHKITSTLKKQYKQEGCYTDERDVKLEGDKFVAIPVEDAQISIYDL